MNSSIFEDRIGLAPSAMYTSCIKVDGKPILPPLMTEARRAEMRRYKELALDLELRLRLRDKNKTTAKSISAYTESVNVNTENESPTLMFDAINADADTDTDFTDTQSIPTSPTKSEARSEVIAAAPNFAECQSDIDSWVGEVEALSSCYGAANTYDYEQHFVIKKTFFKEDDGGVAETETESETLASSTDAFVSKGDDGDKSLDDEMFTSAVSVSSNATFVIRRDKNGEPDEGDNLSQCLSDDENCNFKDDRSEGEVISSADEGTHDGSKQEEVLIMRSSRKRPAFYFDEADDDFDGNYERLEESSEPESTSIISKPFDQNEKPLESACIGSVSVTTTVASISSAFDQFQDSSVSSRTRNESSSTASVYSHFETSNKISVSAPLSDNQIYPSNAAQLAIPLAKELDSRLEVLDRNLEKLQVGVQEMKKTQNKNIAVGLPELQSKMKSLSPKYLKMAGELRSPLLKGVAFPHPLHRSHVPVKVPAKVSDPAMKAKFDRVTAYVRGYLTRRLLHSDKVQTIVQTIRDTVEFLLNMYEERSTNPFHVQLRQEDVNFHRMLIQQLNAACSSFHGIFFKLTPAERMAIIATDRQKLKAKALREQQSGSMSAKKPKVNISSATCKAIERRLSFKPTNPFKEPMACSSVNRLSARTTTTRSKRTTISTNVNNNRIQDFKGSTSSINSSFKRDQPKQTPSTYLTRSVAAASKAKRSTVSTSARKSVERRLTFGATSQSTRQRRWK